MRESENPIHLRILFAEIGGAAGLFFWLLIDVLPDMVDNLRLLMLLAAFSASLFGAMLLMVGRLGLLAAARYATAIALVSSLLLFWASFRYDDVNQFFDSGHSFFAMFLLAHLPLPFVMSQETAPAGWRDYEGLFDHAWSIFVRSATAWSFTGLFWLVIFLSDQLLGLVGFDYLGDFVERAWVAGPLTGMVLGLALAVLNELGNVVSTLRRLTLQLLRLLLPLVAIVVALFIALVPFQGLDKVFGSLSAAGTMLAMAAGAVTLITSALDARDDDTARSKIMVISAKVLSVLLPIIAAIAVYAIWVRVAQYGWTPARLGAVTISGIVLAYALAYASSVLLGSEWRNRIRSANTWMAISVMGLSFLWLTPILNVERISANSHLERFLDGRNTVADLDIWRLGQNWGKAGQAALARILTVTDHKEQAALEDMLKRYHNGESRLAYRSDRQNAENQKNIKTLSEILPVLPERPSFVQVALTEIPRVTIGRILESCQQSLTDGRPGCVAVVASFSREPDERSLVLFWREETGTGLEIIMLRQPNGAADFRHIRSVVSLGKDLESQPAEAVIAKIQDGGFAIVPARLDALEIDGAQIIPRH